MSKLTPNLRVHEIANIYPEVSGEQEVSLEADLVDHGVRDPLVAIGDEIIDGKNRYRLAKKHGLLFDVEQFRGTPLQALAFARSKNAERRHMSSSQRAAAAVKALRLKVKYSGRLGGDSAEKVATDAGTNKPYLFKALKLDEQSPKLLERVASGDLTIPQAIRLLDKRKKNCADWPDNGRIDGMYARLLEVLRGKFGADCACVGLMKESLEMFRNLVADPTAIQ